MPEFHSTSHPGLQRSNNEDCYLCAPDMGLWAVADGMGGHEAGEVASAIAISALKTEFERSGDLEDAIRRAHRAILDTAAESTGASGMGSTLVALRSHGSRYQVSWVGDSRAYLWSPQPQSGRLQRLTSDHSYVQMLLDRGAIDAAEAENHPERHIITQCLGSNELNNVSVDTVQGSWQPGQWILLCSDGLTDELSDARIAQCLAAARAPERACRDLLQLALEAGGRDNITVQIVAIDAGPVRDSDWPRLPGITGRRWLDGGLYGLALLGALVIVSLALG